MKKRYLLGSALALSMGAWAGVASADVFVTATIDKTKDVFVFESIFKDKLVFVTVFADIFPDGVAESDVVVNQRNEFNDVSIGDAEVSATMDGSIDGNTGVVMVNQDVGNMTNQGNALSVAITGSTSAFVDTQASAEQINNDNSVDHQATFDLSTLDREASISGSINNNAGVVNVNQNAGNMNNQLNALAISVGDGLVALAEADLGQFNTDNHVDEFGTNKQGSIDGSVNNNRGVVSVNQSTGNMNNQANVAAISVTTALAASTVGSN